MVAIVVTKCAKMPGSCMGTYRKVYVLDVPYWKAWEHELGKWEPHACNAKDVLRVINDSGPQNVGKTDRCAYRKAIKAAEELARRVNAAGDVAEAEQLISYGSA